MTHVPGETPSLNTLLGLALDRNQRDMETAMPGKVVEFDPPNTVTVDLAYKQVFREGEDRGAYEYPRLTDIPILYPAGGGFSLYMPPAAGDWVLVIFCKYNLERWLSTKGTNVDPGDMGRFTLDGAVAIGGLFPSENTPSGPTNANTAVLNIPTGKELWLGNAASSFIALASKVTSALDILREAIETHKHASFGTPPTAEPLKMPITTNLLWDSDVASKKVKSE